MLTIELIRVLYSITSLKQSVVAAPVAVVVVRTREVSKLPECCSDNHTAGGVREAGKANPSHCP